MFGRGVIGWVSCLSVEGRLWGGSVEGREAVGGFGSCLVVFF